MLAPSPRPAAAGNRNVSAIAPGSRCRGSCNDCWSVRAPVDDRAVGCSDGIALSAKIIMCTDKQKSGQAGSGKQLARSPDQSPRSPGRHDVRVGAADKLLAFQKFSTGRRSILFRSQPKLASRQSSNRGSVFPQRKPNW